MTQSVIVGLPIVIVGLDPTIFLMQKRFFFIISTILFSLLFTSCLADYLNEKMGYKVPVTITYVSDYGKTPSQKKVTPGTILTEVDLPTLTPNDNENDNEFDGWFLDPNYVTSVEAGYTVLENITLYAKWKYNYNAPPTPTHYYATKCIMFDPDQGTGYFTKDEYSFFNESFDIANAYCPEIEDFEYIPGNDRVYLFSDDSNITIIEKYYYKKHFSAQNFYRISTMLPDIENFVYHFYITDYDPDLLVFTYSSAPKATINLEQCSGLTMIPQNAFYQCQWLLEIELPDSIQTIDHFAFYYCNNLKHIRLPSGITTIGQSSFGYCYSLESIEIPDSVTSLNNSSFENCSSLKDINLSENIGTIPLSCFESCEALETIKLPKQTTDIQNFAFSNCTSLKDIYLPASLEIIYSQAFRYCANLQNVYYEGDSIPAELVINDDTINAIKGTDNWHFNSY